MGEEVDAQRIPTLVGLGEMVDLFDVKKQTVYRWNSEGGGRSRLLPDPELVVSGSPLWRLDTILVWAARRGMKANGRVLNRIKKAQGNP